MMVASQAVAVLLYTYRALYESRRCEMLCFQLALSRGLRFSIELKAIWLTKARGLCLMRP